MAGIEKICEFSGVYGGCDMYIHKRDLIQVLPKHLKEFKNRDAILFMMEPRLVNYSNHRLWYSFELGSKFNYKSIYIPKIFSSYYWFWRKWGPCYSQPSLVYDYCLYVPEVQGNVQGKYWNYTQRPQRAIKKLAKLVTLHHVIDVPFNHESPHYKEQEPFITEHIAHFDDWVKEDK